MSLSERPEENPVDPISEIIAYVMNTPGNTNPAILREMIEALTSQTTTNSDGSDDNSGDIEFKR